MLITEEGVKVEDGNTTKDQVEPIEAEKEISPAVAASVENEVPVEVSVCQMFDLGRELL